jgi:hypothetical protein
VKEMVNRAGPSSAIFPQHSIGSSDSPQMGVGEATLKGSRKDIDARQSIPARRGVVDLRRIDHHNGDDAANRSDGRHLGHVALESHHAYPSKHVGPPRSPGELTRVMQNRRIVLSMTSTAFA